MFCFVDEALWTYWSASTMRAVFAVVKLMGPVLDAVQAVVEQKLDVFGAAGKRVL